MSEPERLLLRQEVVVLQQEMLEAAFRSQFRSVVLLAISLTWD